MKPALTLILLACLASPAGAACYADYKAKKDDPLQLHYGVIEIPDDACDPAAAAAILAQRLADGWQLLQVTSVFGPEGLEDRRDSAGEFFLRY
ncbi:hypothetical protein [Jannaschia ovalis]|uniref:DUF4177 domain-containing protein n=1 Tax=Jannaschia ovalis TaxID=3038773 RepID=A0ABY8L702_9RHOB|nr:hypothetical protein [Jannaschia sp. GRR-S6-38]WGH77156.1 hypothetical protein P8627_08790 [Jannaschia sp. GRR-S6-38]